MNKMFRSSKNRVLAGVCAGVADFFGLDVKLVRVAWLIALLFAGVGALLYLILWFVVPEK
jgi:phage shock protein PspC (stress-responsive transcriptional regulator)